MAFLVHMWGPRKKGRVTSHEKLLMDGQRSRPMAPGCKDPVYPLESEVPPCLGCVLLWDPEHREINRCQRGRVSAWPPTPVAPELSLRPVA